LGWTAHWRRLTALGHTVPVKSAEQQAAAMVLSARDLLIGQRTQLVNARWLWPTRWPARVDDDVERRSLPASAVAG
jgi:hypothetical protein